MGSPQELRVASGDSQGEMEAGHCIREMNFVNNRNEPRSRSLPSQDPRLEQSLEDIQLQSYEALTSSPNPNPNPNSERGNGGCYKPRSLW